MGNIRKTIHLDVGFGDIVIPRRRTILFPTLLEYPAPYIQVYTRESIIAEKFQAIVCFSDLTSRMKDFYDILFLADKFSLKVYDDSISTNHEISVDNEEISW